MLALAKEFDLVKTWNKYVTESLVLRETDLTEMTVYVTVWMPWPFNDISIVMQSLGTDLLEEEGCLVVLFHSPPDPLDPDLLPPGLRKPGLIRVMPGSCIKFTPLPPLTPGGPQRVHSTVVAHLGAGTLTVPTFIITFVLKVLTPFIYNIVVKLLKKAFKKPTDPLPQRMAAKPAVYDLVASAVAKHFARCTAAQAQRG